MATRLRPFTLHPHGSRDENPLPKIQDNLPDQIERRQHLAALGLPDRGQSLADLRAQAGANPSPSAHTGLGAGSNATPRSPDMARLNAKLPPLTLGGGVANPPAKSPDGLNPVPPAGGVNSPGIQQALDAVPSTAANIAAEKARIAAAAGTGKPLETGYGMASSRTAAPSEGGLEPKIPLNPSPQGPTPTGAALADTGPKRDAPLTWDQQIAKDHPEIAKEGSEANKALIAAHYNAMQTRAGYDPAKHAVQLANDTMAPIYASRGDKGPLPEDVQASAAAGGLAEQKKAVIADAMKTQAPTKAQRVQAAVPLTPENTGGLAGVLKSVKGAVSDATGWVADKLGAGRDALATGITGTPPSPAAPPQMIAPATPPKLPPLTMTPPVETEEERQRKRTARSTGVAPYVPGG